MNKEINKFEKNEFFDMNYEKNVIWIVTVLPLRFWRNNSSGSGGTKSILSGALTTFLGSLEVNSAADSAVEDTN